MSNAQMFEVVVDNVVEAGNFATRDEADKAADGARTRMPHKNIVVRETQSAATGAGNVKGQAAANAAPHGTASR